MKNTCELIKPTDTIWNVNKINHLNNNSDMKEFLDKLWDQPMSVALHAS